VQSFHWFTKKNDKEIFCTVNSQQQNYTTLSVKITQVKDKRKEKLAPELPDRSFLRLPGSNSMRTFECSRKYLQASLN
jgi:hypothetical protein